MTTKSLRKQVFEYLSDNPNVSVKTLVRKFSTYSKTTVKRYYFIWKHDNNTDVIGDILIENIDTIKEMEKTIQLIKDPDKRATQLSRLHAMKLRPISNKNQISLKEMLDGSN